MINKISDLFKFGKKIALKSADKQYTFKQLYNLSNKLPQELNKKCLILVITENKIDLYAIFLILLTFKSKLILINHDEKNLHNVISKYKPHYIINTNINFKNYSLLCKFQKFLNIYKCENIINYKIHNSLKILLSTSGSTADPKFVKLTSKNLLHNSKGIIKSLNINRGSYPITTLPLSYSYGLSIFNSHIFSGNKIFVSNLNIFETKFWNYIKKFNITTFGGVPIFYDMILRSEFLHFNNSSLKYLTQAGGRIDKSTFVQLKNIMKIKKIKFFLMYGQTESTARISVKSVGIDDEISIGEAIEGTKIFIGNKKYENLKDGQTGEIKIKSESIYKGYANSFKDLSFIKNIKILNTGDLGVFSLKSGIKIIGRTKRISKIWGKRINLDSIERIFAKDDKRVFVKSDDKILFIYSTKITLKEIDKIFKKNYIDLPFKYKKIKKIPLKLNGKVDYSKLC